MPENLGLDYKGLPRRKLAGSRLGDIEKQTILETLEEYGYNFSKSSSALGISRATLYNKVKKYQLSIRQINV